MYSSFSRKQLLFVRGRTNVLKYYKRINYQTQREILTKRGRNMYKEYPKFIANEVLEYDRKSRFDDPYLAVEEV